MSVVMPSTSSLHTLDQPLVYEEHDVVFVLGRFYASLAATQSRFNMPQEQLDPYSAHWIQFDYLHGGPSPLQDMLHQRVPRFDGLGCAGGPTEMIERAHVLCEFRDTVEAFRTGRLVARTPAEYARTWFPTDPALINHLIPAHRPIDARTHEIYVLVALMHRVQVAYVEFHRLMDVRRRTCTDEEGIRAKEARAAAERQEMVGFDFSPSGNFKRMASHIRRCAENTHTIDYELQQACFMWKQYLTVHFQLMRYFWLHPTSPEMWRDSQLMVSGDDAVKCVYDACYPDLRRPISINMLPNLATTVARLSWFRETEGNRNEAVAHLLAKVMNKICAVRGWKDIATSYIEKNDGIMELMMMCTMVSVLRLYPHSDECPTMATALSMWHRFSVMTENIEEYKEWLAENTQLMWFSLREYLLFMLQRDRVLYYVLTRFNNVPAVSQSVTRGMDHACRIYNLKGTFDDPADNIDVQSMLLTEYYKAEQLRDPIKVHKKPYLEILWGSLCRVFERQYMSNRRYCYIHHTPPDEVERMERYVAKLAPNASTIFRRYHFIHWGLQETTIDLLFACKDSYEIASDADHATASHLKTILVLPAAEFFRLLNFTHLLVQHSSFEPIPLSCESAEAQACALRDRLDIPAWEPITRDHYATHMCHKCHRICTQVSIPCWRSGAAGGGASGGVGLFAESGFANETLLCRQMRVNHVRYDPTRDTLICRRSTQLKPGSFQEHRFTSVTDMNVTNLLYKAGNQISTGTPQNDARHLRQLITGEYCRDTPLTLIPMIGVAWRIGTKIYASCETCYSPVQITINSHGPRGITCSGHTHDEYALYRPRQVLFPRMGPIPPPLDASRMSNNLVLHNSALDWNLLESLPPDMELFSIEKRIEARKLLRRGRSVPAGVDPDTYNGAPLSASASRRNKSVRYTLQLGVMKTCATVGGCAFLSLFKHRPELTNDWTQGLRYASTCYFCGVPRIKQGRPDDRAWVTFGVMNDDMDPVLIFLCATCKTAVPTIRESGKIETMGMERLGELKLKVSKKRGNPRFTVNESI